MWKQEKYHFWRDADSWSLATLYKPIHSCLYCQGACLWRLYIEQRAWDIKLAKNKSIQFLIGTIYLNIFIPKVCATSSVCMPLFPLYSLDAVRLQFNESNYNLNQSANKLHWHPSNFVAKTTGWEATWLPMATFQYDFIWYIVSYHRLQWKPRFLHFGWL